MSERPPRVRHGYQQSARRRLDCQARSIDSLSWQNTRQDEELTELLGQVQDLERLVADLRIELARLRLVTERAAIEVLA